MVVVVYAPTFCVWATFTLAYTLVCIVIMVVLLCVDCLTILWDVRIARSPKSERSYATSILFIN